MASTGGAIREVFSLPFCPHPYGDAKDYGAPVTIMPALS